MNALFLYIVSYVILGLAINFTFWFIVAKSEWIKNKEKDEIGKLFFIIQFLYPVIIPTLLIIFSLFSIVLSMIFVCFYIGDFLKETANKIGEYILKMIGKEELEYDKK